MSDEITRVLKALDASGGVPFDDTDSDEVYDAETLLKFFGLTDTPDDDEECDDD
jgi:hypothetical protein